MRSFCNIIAHILQIVAHYITNCANLCTICSKLLQFVANYIKLMSICYKIAHIVTISSNCVQFVYNFIKLISICLKLFTICSICSILFINLLKFAKIFIILIYFGAKYPILPSNLLVRGPSGPCKLLLWGLRPHVMAPSGPFARLWSRPFGP